jgi:hypothetical protein
MWALRDAAAANGHYSSPQQASDFFGRIANEISAACANGKLECKRQLVADMPPIDWSDVVRRMLSRYVDAFHLLVLVNPPLNLNVSAGSASALAPALRFLNDPLYTRSAEKPGIDTYTISGWYNNRKADWITADVKTSSGKAVGFQFDRLASPDVQLNSKEPGARNQHFLLSTRCNDGCVAHFRAPEGDIIQLTLRDFRTAPFEIWLGKGKFHVERTSYQPDPDYARSRLDEFCRQIRDLVMTYYSWLFLPILTIGVISFLVSGLRYWRKAVWNVCFLMALVGWGLAFERTTLLLLIDSSSFPALNPFYLSPAYFMLVSGAVFSIAALLQLASDNQPSMRNRVSGPMKER